MIPKLIAHCRAWRGRRRWAAMHLEWLRTMVHGDARWLASNPIARAITERYEAALRDDWYALDHEDTPRLRTRLGLDPSRASGPAPNDASGVPEATRQHIIAEFLERTGQWVTNDASRDAAIKEAVDKALASHPGPHGWRDALKFYADQNHFVIADDKAWDKVSGEPTNFYCDEAGTATVEDGSVAAAALRGVPLPDEETMRAALPDHDRSPASGRSAS